MIERKIFDTTLAGKKITVEFNPIAAQASGSVFVSCGGTTVFAATTMMRTPRETVEYFPLMVDYEEKYYAAGRILGSRFVRREGRPSEEAILIGRLIDRTIRPLFDQRIRHDVQVTVYTLSLDDEHSPDIFAILAASLALATSDIPWAGPVSAVRIGKTDGSYIVNPTDAERISGTIDLVVSGGHERINMLEGKAQEVSEEAFAEAIEHALGYINELDAFQKKIIAEVGKKKFEHKLEEIPLDAKSLFTRHILPRLKDALFIPNKKHREHTLGDLKAEWLTSIKELTPSLSRGTASEMYEEAINDIVHENAIVEGKRPDGRGFKEVRQLYGEAQVLSRTHGSGLFFRGDTHILSVVTLGAPGDELLIEGMDIRLKKHFIHHYNFPSFSVGEVKPMRGPGRREIGHGALAEKALEAVIPPKEDFPYTIRVVSETLSSNGSSSMGSVCASTIALMDAGVPIKRPVAGIAMGLMMKDENTYKVLTDIQGPEDHHGDMDFKAAGTAEGITAVQMDVKVNGVTVEILREALADAREARLTILKAILAAIPTPRPEPPEHAPRVIKIQINVDKIRDVIGPGGKIINEIIAETGAQIDIEQTGIVYVTGASLDSARAAETRILEITKEFMAGEIVRGKVSRIFEFGAMVEIAPKQEGLVHISELAGFRVGKVTDIVNVGDEVEAKIIEIDSMGRINLSVRALTESEEEMKERRSARPARSPSPGGHRPRH